jgi:type IV pilus assembly protein PilW
MQRQRGLSITEFMVALAIGALLVLLAATLVVGASNAWVAHTEKISIDEAGRFALAALERAARQAGVADWEREDAAGTDPAAPPPVMGLDAASLSSDSNAISNPRPAAINGSDVLALRFSGAGQGEGDGSVSTCAGFSVGEGQDGWSIFYVGLSAEGRPELRCKYRGANNWSAEAVVGGVDSFQVLYGLDTDSVPDGQANRYVSASAITALDAAQGTSDEGERMRRTWWKRVASIKVALALHGARPSKGAGGAVYHLFGRDYSELAGDDTGVRIDTADLVRRLREHERRTFSATIQLRNPAP